MARRLFLIDAYAIIYRSYYAFIKQPRINSKGENTSAVFGFVNTLEELIHRENPDCLAVCFDPKGPTFRHEAYEHYKAQREETPEVIQWSVPRIKSIIEAYNIPIMEVPGFEADDVIGTLSRLGEEAGFDVFMMTPDKDCGQLVTDHVFMYKPKYGSNEFEVLGPKEIMNKYSLTHPKQIIDLLGLMGDASDNIPGCPGIGEVTAKKLIAEYGSIDNLLNSYHELKGKLKEKIENNLDLISFSRFLATIRTDVPIDFNEEVLTRKPVSLETVKELFEQLEFRALFQRVEKNANTSIQLPKIVPPKITLPNAQQLLWDEPNLFNQGENVVETAVNSTKWTEEKKESILKDINLVPHTYQILDNEADILNFIAILRAQKMFCLDTETTGLNPLTCELVGISFCWEKGNAWYIALNTSKVKTEVVLSNLRPILEDPSKQIIGQNIKFDLLVLKHHGINLKGELFDTMIAHYLLQPELKHGMDYLAEIYLGYKTIHIDELIGGKGKQQLNMKDVPLEKIGPYAAEDADITLQLYEWLEPELKTNGLEFLSREIEMPLIKVLAEMEYQGVSIDTESLKQASLSMTSTLEIVEKEIQELAGTSFNVNSPKQIGEILFETLKIDSKAKKTKTGQYSTSEDVLEKLKSKHPVVEKILEQRGLKKLLSTYIDALPALINPTSGKIHTSFNQAITATGRLSSSNPNLQNIPIRDAIGREIRKAFSCKPDEYFVSADYSQIELRLMAHLSKDETMIEAFRKDQDIHAATAAKIYNIPLDEVTSDMRRKAKTANFGIIYGISVFGLAERMGVNRSEAKELIDGYFETYPAVKKYMEDVVIDAKNNGWVETLYHRKRFLPDITSHNAVVRGYAERNAINAPIQGTAADIIKIAMVNIYNALEKKSLRSKMILQVHDELNFIVPKDELKILLDLVRKEMEAAAELLVPLKADIGYGANWLEAH